MKYTTFTIVITMLICSSCRVGPDYRVPDVNVPAHFGAIPPDKATGPTDVKEWWTKLNDSTLTWLIEQTLSSNLDLKVAHARIAQARAARGLVTAETPTASLKAGDTQSRASRNTPLGAFLPKREDSDYLAGFDMAWEIDIFGGISRSVEAAEADIAAATANDRDVMVSLSAEVARVYIALRQVQKRMDIAQESIRLQQSTLDIVNGRFKAGLTTELDVQQATAQLEGARAAMPALDTAMNQTMYRLAFLMAKEPQALKARLAAAAPIPATQPLVPVGLPSDLLRRRPDIRRAERQLAASSARIGAATADLFPRFGMTGSLGQESSNTNNLFDSSSRYWSITPGFIWPILDAGRIRANVRLQNARQEEAMALYIRSIMAAMSDVESSLVAYGNEQQRMQRLEAEVTAVKRSVELANDLYTKGLTDFLTLLDAERRLFQVQDQLAESQGATATNLVALYKALGGGWDDAK
jgi:NodT family efflux transporter outer membrane factor (OMF) lipoprotein